MSNLQEVQFDNQFSSWQRTSAFNTYWQYSYLTRAAFYANVKAEYREYMTRWVQNALWWYDGWVPYFHSNQEGIFSTRVASALVDGAAKKVIGGRIFFKNANRETQKTGEINKALHFISSEWSPKVKLSKEIKRATTFAAAAGSSLLKLNKDEDGLWAEALRFDSFYPVIGARGKLLEVVCFLRNFVNLSPQADWTGVESFYVVEHRYFGDYKRLDGTILNDVPMVEYKIKKSAGTVVNGQDYDAKGSDIFFMDLPKSVRRNIGKAYPFIRFDCPILLPFVHHLGAVLVNWTDGVSNIPELPFGDSLLSNIMPYLQSWDYYFSAFNTDMYIGRGQVIMPAYMSKDKGAGSGGFYEGKNGLMFTKIPVGANPEDQKPLPVQFDLRSTSWKEIRDMLMQNIAINTRMNISTIASFLQDNTGTKTAREISTEESETALFVDDKREIIERPINELLNIVLRYYGFTDDVVIRWSQAGLSNVYTRTDMIATAVQNGFCSKYKAVQMFDQDDDEYQIKEEYDRCVKDGENKTPQGGGLWDEQDYYGVQEESSQKGIDNKLRG